MSTQKRFRKNKTQATEDSTVEPSPYAATFSGDDPTAWGWLNLYPFGDGAEAEGAHGPENDAGTRPRATRRPPPAPRPTPSPSPRPRLRPVPVPEPEVQPEPEPELESVPTPALAVRRRPSEARAALARVRPRRRAGIAVLVAVAVVVVSALTWTGRGGDGGRIRPVSGDPYAPPVRLSPATAYVRSRVLPSGDLEVTHWIRARHSVDSLTVRTPAVLGSVTGTVKVSHIVLAIDGTKYPAISLDQGPPDTQTFRFPFAGAVYLRYRLSGVVQATGPGGLALARVTALNVWTDGEVARTTRTVVGARVLEMACATGPPDSNPTPCGSPEGGTWTVRLDQAKQTSRVTARVDLS